MIESAVAALKANEATALAEFNDKDNKQFHYRDLCVFCINVSDGKFTAHLSKPALIGKDSRTLNVRGDPFGQRLYNTIKASPQGSIITVGYKALRPGTTELVPKVSFMARVGNQGCGFGYYR